MVEKGSFILVRVDGISSGPFVLLACFVVMALGVVTFTIFYPFTHGHSTTYFSFHLHSSSWLETDLIPLNFIHTSPTMTQMVRKFRTLMTPRTPRCLSLLTF